MADAEAPDQVKSTTAPPAAAPVAEPAPPPPPPSIEQDKVETAEPEKEPSQTHVVVSDQPKKKFHKDFWFCTGLLVIFGLVCAIGFVVLKFTVFAAGSEKAKLLEPNRMTAFHGAVNVDRKFKDP